MSSGTFSMSEPVCLIENDKDGKLRVRPQALEILRQIDQRVVVVAVVGLYRTGKSYLMNKLAGKRMGFALGATIQSKTKGIWMWALPHPIKVGHTLVLLDTEGLGDVEKGDEKNDNWIFSLAVLLSSTLVYNSMGVIDNDALQRLHYVTELTEYIKVKSQARDEDESVEFMHFFPSFVWTVRDFTLLLEHDGKAISSDQYLEKALELRTGHGKVAMNYNMPRNCLRNYFSERKCFVFDRPANTEKMRCMDKLTDEDLEPSFVEQANTFCDYIFNHTKIKSIKGGYNVTGRMLGNLAKMYVDAICSGQIPCLDNAVVALARIENANAVTQAVTSYKNFMADFVAYPTETQEELSDIHGKAEESAVKVFMEFCFKDEDQKHQLELMELLQTEYKAICDRNVAESNKACESIIKQIFRPLEENINDGHYMAPGGYQQYQKDIKNFISGYRSADGKGIKDEEALKEYLVKQGTIEKSIMAADRSLTDAQRREEENRARMEAMEQERRAAEKERVVFEKQIMDQERSYKENMEQLMRKMEEDRKNAAEENQRVLTAKLEEQQNLHQQGFAERAKVMQGDIDSLKKAKDDNQKSGSSSFLANVVGTMGMAATFLPGIAPKLAGIGLAVISRWLK